MVGITTEKKSSASVNYQPGQNYTGPLIVVTMLFFMWGFITCLNDILIPKLQQVFTLEHWQAMLIQTAFFGAYFIISLIYFIISTTKGDPILKIGYKNGIIIGLIVAAIGCLLFYPAASLESYGFFLGALFVLASGVTVLQITANPYVAILGPPEGASSRLNMTQAFNSFGTTIAPLIGGYLIFEATELSGSTGSASVKMPYIVLALTLFLIAVIFKLFKLPEIAAEDEEGITSSTKGALQYPHLVLGVICIFAYVGGEVTIGSNLINFLKLPNIAGMDEAQASQYLAFFWGGAMVGRFFGAVALGQFKNNLYRYLIIGAIALISFLTIYGLYDLDMAYITLAMIAANVFVIILGQFVPHRTLALFSVSVLVLLFMTIFQQGQLAMWSVIAIGLFNSIMFPTIFALAIKGLGVYTSQASSLLVMAIVGGAIVPPIQGLIADLMDSVQFSFVVPLICYAYIAYYGFVGYKPKRAETVEVLK